MRIGIVVPHLGASQLAFWLISEINEFLTNNPLTDIVVFYEESVRECLLPHFARFPSCDLHNHEGPLVATTLSTARKVISAVGDSKFFYVWDTEWHRGHGCNYEELARVYREPRLTLLARSEEHRQHIRQTWARDSLLCENFSMEALARIIRESVHRGGLDEIILVQPGG